MCALSIWVVRAGRARRHTVNHQMHDGMPWFCVAWRPREQDMENEWFVVAVSSSRVLEE